MCRCWATSLLYLPWLHATSPLADPCPPSIFRDNATLVGEYA